MWHLAENLKKRMASGQKVFGQLIGPGNDPLDTVGTLKEYGYDLVMVDMEHNLVDRETVFEYVRAAREIGIPLLLRPEECNAFFRNYLDSGVDGLMLPHVDSVEQAVFGVNQCFLPPIGHRGCGFSSYLVETQARGSTPFLTLTERINRRTLLFPQTESLASISNLSTILSLNGVTGTVVGTYDLAIDMGGIDPGALLAEIITSAPVERRLEEVARICGETGRVAGIGGLSPQGCARWAKEGYQMFFVGQVVDGNVTSVQPLIEETLSLIN